MSPRCGRPMRGYEAVWGALPEAPECARPEGHNGPCRSALALRRKQAGDIARIAEARRAGRYTHWWVRRAA